MPLQLPVHFAAGGGQTDYGGREGTFVGGSSCPAARRTLGVCVHHKHCKTPPAEASGKHHRHGGLTAAPLLVHYANDSGGHGAVVGDVAL